MIAWATVLASIIIFVSFATLVLAVGGDAVDAVGGGLFCTFWGGPGFGVMAGGAAHAVSMDRLRVETSDEDASSVRETAADGLADPTRPAA